jgi:release factor glutamine methyltransferase
MEVRQALRQGRHRLEQGAIGEAGLTAELLLCHALGRERAWLHAHWRDSLPDEARRRFEWSLQERISGTPFQYITGKQEFYGREFLVNRSVLIPRPETEHVVETAVRLAPDARRAVDIGCGSGAIAVTWALERRLPVIATDVSPAAALVARENARRLSAPVEFLACDLASALPARAFDLVLSNPPYIPEGDREGLQREIRDHEPAVALYGGPTGVEIYGRLIADAKRILVPGGWLIMELGYRAKSDVCAMLDVDWLAPEIVPDLAGWPRVAAVRLQG